MSEPKIVFEMPKMSWDIPIEDEILMFCNEMARGFRTKIASSSWWSDDTAAEAYASAYETVIRHILGEKRIRHNMGSEQL
jgi:hypothetical protein